MWRTPKDDFGKALADALACVLANTSKPGRALEPIRDILAGLYLHYDQKKVDRLGWMGDELSEKLEEAGINELTTLGQFCDRLRELIGTPDPSGYSTNVGEMLVWAQQLTAKCDTPQQSTTGDLTDATPQGINRR